MTEANAMTMNETVIETFNTSQGLTITSNQSLANQSIKLKDKILSDDPEVNVTTSTETNLMKLTTEIKTSKNNSDVKLCGKRPNTSTSFLSSGSYCSTLHISTSIFVGVVGMLGIVGNCVSIRILAQIKTSLSTSLLLSALAVEDCLFLVTMATVTPCYTFLVTMRVQYKLLVYVVRYCTETFNWFCVFLYFLQFFCYCNITILKYVLILFQIWLPNVSSVSDIDHLDHCPGNSSKIYSCLFPPQGKGIYI